MPETIKPIGEKYFLESIYTSNILVHRYKTKPILYLFLFIELLEQHFNRKRARILQCTIVMLGLCLP